MFTLHLFRDASAIPRARLFRETTLQAESIKAYPSFSGDLQDEPFRRATDHEVIVFKSRRAAIKRAVAFGADRVDFFDCHTLAVR